MTPKNVKDQVLIFEFGCVIKKPGSVLHFTPVNHQSIIKNNSYRENIQLDIQPDTHN